MKSFVTRLALFLALQAAIFLVLFVSAQKAPDPYIGTLIDKHARAAAVKGPRLLLVGGSNLVFGTWSEDFARQLPYQPVNLGVHAGFGLDFILQDALAEVRQGDLVALVLEYSLFDDDETTKELWEALICRPEVALHMDKPRLFDSGFQFIGHVTRRGRRELLGEYGRPDEGIYSRGSFNEFGDNVAHRLLPTNYKSVRNHFDPMSANGPPGFKRNLELLEDFVARCEARGADVVAFFPTLPESIYRRDCAGITRVTAALRRILGARVLGRDEDIPLPEDQFFDSDYHLIGTAGRRRTQMMIDRITAFERTHEGAKVGR